MGKYPVLFVFILSSCLMPESELPDSISIMTWNVQNLFDDEYSGLEYDEYNPEESDWDEQKMRIKLENLSEPLLQLDEKLPDILLLQEVENQDIVERLNREYLGGYYKFTNAWESSQSAICNAVLSVFIPEEVHLHYPGSYGKTPLRPLSEIHFLLGDERLILFNNHWKSRSGGQLATEEARIMSSAVLTRRIGELRTQGYHNVIVAGDLNGSCDDYRPGGHQTAQIPVQDMESVSWKNSIFISSDKQDTLISGEKVILYSPWAGMDAPGSYYFQNRWMKLDHFLLDRGLFDGQGLDFLEADCLNLPILSDDSGQPFSWESWRSAGVSDHFPLYLSLKSDIGL